jgi:ankyrin repeat protein
MSFSPPYSHFHDSGAPVTCPNFNGFTPLHLAVQLNDIPCIMALLNMPGVDIDAVTLSGFTPLYLSLATGSKEAEKVLRENGAKTHVDSRRRIPGGTALDFVVKRTNHRTQLAATQLLDKHLGLLDRHTMC